MKLRVIHNLGVHFDVRGGDPEVRGGGRDEAANAGARTADGDVPMVVVTGGGRAVAEDGAQTVVEGGARTVAEDVSKAELIKVEVPEAERKAAVLMNYTIPAPASCCKGNFCTRQFLVTTNDHLLKELDETRERHSTEINQINWRYKQLKENLQRPV
ncbi:hypothetical protein DPMN_004968 [Dreissena polymorpha]|uniref:Uncharacterized protein n=1 Tax=Dreissena polymorpha TaxID=45954 RepID=A0A9D4MSB2_DREPO|nr:hypothetical protein DPMN_004968 [Dreissena polymorpha]